MLLVRELVAVFATELKMYRKGQLEFTNGTTNPSSSWNDTPNYNDNTTTRMVIKQDGKIGMGTTSPARNLEIENSGSYVGLKIDNSDASSAGVFLKKTIICLLFSRCSWLSQLYN